MKEVKKGEKTGECQEKGIVIFLCGEAAGAQVKVRLAGDVCHGWYVCVYNIYRYTYFVGACAVHWAFLCVYVCASSVLHISVVCDC